jgi:hypothetical protein
LESSVINNFEDDDQSHVLLVPFSIEVRICTPDDVAREVRLCTKPSATTTSDSNPVATHTATDQTLDTRNTLRYLGVPIKSPTPTFGDNDFMANYSKVWQTLEPVLFWRDERYYGFHRWICSVLEDSCPGADRWGVLKLRSVIRVMSLQEPIFGVTPSI